HAGHHAGHLGRAHIEQNLREMPVIKPRLTIVETDDLLDTLIGAERRQQRHGQRRGAARHQYPHVDSRGRDFERCSTFEGIKQQYLTRGGGTARRFRRRRRGTGAPPTRELKRIGTVLRFVTIPVRLNSWPFARIVAATWTASCCCSCSDCSCFFRLLRSGGRGRPMSGICPICFGSG